MPFIIDEKREQALKRVVELPEVEEDVSFGDAFMAAYRQENIIGALSVKGKGLPDAVVENTDFNPFELVTEDELQDDLFMENAALADNTEELDALRKQYARETEDRQTLANAGATGFLANIAAGTLDPINFIPVGGAAYKTYKTGGSVLTGAAVTAGSATATTAVQETALHQAQLQRTFGESALNVSAATLLAGTLHLGGSGLRKIFSDNPSIEREINESLDPESAIKQGGNPAYTGEFRSAGAAAAIQDVKVKGKVAEKFVKYLGFDPLSRSLVSDAKSARILAAELAESPIDVDGYTGQAVESLIKIHDGKYVEGLQGHISEFKAYRKRIKDEGGKAMSRREFNERVASEIRNPGSDILEIKNSAKNWQDKLYNPLKDEAINAKLLPDDVDVATATNYLNRVWNKQKIAAKLPEFKATVSKWLMEKNPELDAYDAEEIALDIAGRIRGTPDGRLPYDYKMGENLSKGKGKQGLKGTFKSRSFTIDDSLVEEFLENDIEKLGARYLRSMAPDIELQKRFGDVNMEAQLKDVEAEYSELMEAAKSEKQRLKLEKQKDRAIADIAAMRDRIRGTFGEVDYDNPWVRIGRLSRDINYMRFMGGVVASSLPDISRTLMAEGFVNTFKNGLGPLVRNVKSFKVSAQEAKRAGVGVDTLMGGRAEVLADIADYSQGGTAFERAVRTGAEKFSKVNLMNQWTTAMKQLHAVTMQNTIIPKMMNGKFDKRLVRLGISEADQKNIGQQLKRYGKKVDGSWIASTKDWDNPHLVEMYQVAMRKESDRVIVMPGQEKPLFMSAELGKTIFQFRSFMFSATQRVLISGIQGQDANFIGGALSLVSIGAMAYVFKQWDADREISDDPRVWVTEGIDRSGLTGILMEANNTLEKISANSLGLRPLLGLGQPASRFASRSQAEAFLGPTFGSLLTTTLTVASSGASEREWTDADTRALRRLLPYQNLTFFRQLLDKVEESIGG